MSQIHIHPLILHFTDLEFKFKSLSFIGRAATEWRNEIKVSHLPAPLLFAVVVFVFVFSIWPATLPSSCAAVLLVSPVWLVSLWLRVGIWTVFYCLLFSKHRFKKYKTAFSPRIKNIWNKRPFSMNKCAHVSGIWVIFGHAWLSECGFYK